MNDKTALYRAFSDRDELLYIGISKNALKRFIQHTEKSEWTEFMTRLEVEYFESRKEALKQEKRAIIEEKPLFNVIHNREDRFVTSPDIATYQNNNHTTKININNKIRRKNILTSIFEYFKSEQPKTINKQPKTTNEKIGKDEEYLKSLEFMNKLIWKELRS